LKIAMDEINASKPLTKDGEIKSLDDKKNQLIADGVPEIEATEFIESEKKKIIDRYAKQELAERQQRIEKDFAIAKKGTSALQSLSDIYFSAKLSKATKGSAEEEKLARKQFALNKKLQLAGAIVDTAKAAIMSLAQAPVAIGPIPNPAGIASLAFALVTGAASIAKIASTSYESTSGGGSASAPSIGSAGDAGGSASTIPQVGNTNLGNAGQVTNTQAPDNRVYVVESDIKKTANRVNVIESRATIG
jgi:hypothetical protein